MYTILYIATRTVIIAFLGMYIMLYIAMFRESCDFNIYLKIIVNNMNLNKKTVLVEIKMFNKKNSFTK